MSLIEERARAVFERYSIKEIRIPVLERTQLYLIAIGNDTARFELGEFALHGSFSRGGERCFIADAANHFADLGADLLVEIFQLCFLLNHAWVRWQKLRRQL